MGFAEVINNRKQNTGSGFSAVIGNRNTYSSLPYQDKVNQWNEKDIEELAKSGELDRFLQYKKPTLWDNMKAAGVTAIDLLSRTSYASGSFLENMYEGENVVDAGKSALKEIFSGAGGLKGEKKTPSERLKANNPDYAQYVSEHPVMGAISNFGIDVATDPLTLIPGKAIATGVTKTTGLIGKGISKVTPGGVKDLVGNMFDTAYGWKKAGAPKGAEIKWQETQKAAGLRRQYNKRLNPIIDTIAGLTPAQAKNLAKVMYDGVPANDNTVADIAPKLQKSMKTMGRYENWIKRGEDMEATPLIKNYLPNNPKEYTDLMSESGDYLGRGYTGGLVNYKRPFEKGKKIKTGDDFLNFLTANGVKDEDIAEVIVRNITGRTHQSVSRVRQIRLQNRLINEVVKEDGTPVFRKLAFGTHNVWDKDREGQALVKNGESIWMNSGNLRFFKQDYIKSNAKFNDALEQGTGVMLSTDELVDALKHTVGVSKDVEAYAVPVPILEEINKVSTNFARESKALDWWDTALKYWKGFAVLSPGFHVRNLISSVAQNYVADINPMKYADAIKIFATKDPSVKIAGKSVGAWKKLFNDNGISTGSLIGQEVQGVGAPVIKQAFAGSRYVGMNIEQINRSALFMDEMAKTKDPLKAALKVKKFHFDYSDLTTTEREVFRRIAPFYAWCVSDDTECLTESGWKKHNDVFIGENILTYNIDKKEFEWKPVEDKFEAPYNHKLLHFIGKSIDLLCTFDHKCITNEGLKYAYTVAQNNTVPTKIKYVKKDYPIDDKIIKLISWIVTDGYSRCRKNFWEFVIYQKKEKQLKEIKELIGNDGSEYIHPDTKVSCVRINGETRKEITKHFKGKEYVWDLFVQLSPRQLQIASDIMMQAEGCCSYKDTKKEFKLFSQENKSVQDVFQLITILSGVISSVSQKGIYIRNKENIKYPKPNIVNYNGIIWCPTTENDTWVARRNGKVIITGNTRNNIPLQLEMVLKAPKKYRNIALLKNAIAGDAETQNNPDWWKNQDIWNIGTNKALYVGLPYSDMNLMASKGLTGMGAVAGIMYSLASNNDPFYEKKITEFKGQTEPMFMGKYLYVPPKVKYAIENLLPITKRYGTDLSKEIKNWITAKDSKSGWRILSKTIGLKIMPNVKDEQKKRQIYDLYNELKEYQKYIQQEERRGK